MEGGGPLALLNKMPLKLASICTETHPTKHTASIKHGEGDGKEDRAHTGMEGRRGSQGASRAAPGKSGLHARGEGERVLALE